MSAVQQLFLQLRKRPHRAGTRCKVPKNEPRPALVADRLRPRSRRCAVPPSKVKRYRARRPSRGMPNRPVVGLTCGYRADAEFAGSRRQFRAKSCSGVPRSMKTGNIASPWRYDAGAQCTLRFSKFATACDFALRSIPLDRAWIAPKPKAAQSLQPTQTCRTGTRVEPERFQTERPVSQRDGSVAQYSGFPFLLMSLIASNTGWTHGGGVLSGG
jgi:hypothetical protein